MEKKNDELRNGMVLYGKQRKRVNNNNNKGGGGGVCGGGGGGGCNCFEFEKDNGGAKSRRLLVSVNVLGSAGALRFLVNEEEVVGGVIESALKMYAKEGRLPALGSSDSFNFLLYCANSGSDALSPWDEIGSVGKRNFVMCKKPDEQQPNMTETRHHFISRKGVRNWKTWLNKSLTFKISSH